MSETNETKVTRPRASAEDFVRVCVNRTEFPTREDAATALGMTEGSFKQRESRERKRYPKLWTAIPEYKVSKVASEDEMAEIFASLGVEVNTESEAETANEGQSDQPNE